MKILSGWGALVLLVWSLSGCPEERPGTEKQIPVQRLPPAVSVEPPPSDGGLTPAADAGRARQP